jgi:hypothetical protein
MAHSPHPTQWQVPECNQRHPWATNPWHLATPDVESLEEQLQQYLGPSQATKKLVTTAGEFVYCRLQLRSPSASGIGLRGFEFLRLH